MTTAKKDKKRILVTGFGPFPGQPDNPSAALVRALKDEFAKSAKLDVRCVVLKTEYKKSVLRLNKEIKAFRPDIVICFGVAAGEKGFRLETLARNRSSTKLADASGYRPKGTRILDKKEATLKATLPFKKIAKNLKEAGIKVRLSDDAGQYLCNYIFYRVRAGHDVPCGFVHIPVPGRDTLSKSLLLRGAKMIIRSV